MDNETIKKDLERLYLSYYELDKKIDKARGKRTIITILVFAAFYFWVLYNISDPVGIEFVYLIVGSVIVGGFHWWINGAIFSQLFQMGREESEALDSIKKRISELEKSLNK